MRKHILPFYTIDVYFSFGTHSYYKIDKRTKEGYVMGYEGGGGYGNNFALIVVLFILLIIVGAAYVGGGY
jgi:uncharacterized protein (TIGR01732 family)